MIKYLFALAFLITACRVQHTSAQTNDSVFVSSQDNLPRQDSVKPDTTNYGPVTVIVDNKDGNGSPKVKAVFGQKDHHNRKKNVDISYLGFELGLNNFSDRSNYGSQEVNDFALAAPGGPEAGPGEFSLRTGKSVNVNIWPIWMKVNLIDHKLNLKTGFGIEMNNYRYSKSISYYNDASRTYIIRDSVKFKKNKLFTEYLTIPVMLDFETNPYHHARSFRIAAGPTFGYLIKSRTKQVSKARGKEKNNDPFNLEKFRTGLRGEIGFGPVTLYGAYSFTPIHQYGLKQYPYSIGIELIGDSNW